MPGSAPGAAPLPGQPAPGPVPPSVTPSSPSAQPSPSASQGHLVAAPARLALVVPAVGTKAHGAFVLTAVGGPVGDFVITVPAQMAARIKVSPYTGSLPAGGQVQVTVTVTGRTPFHTDLYVNPGNITVPLTVVVS
jgi:hypothetical protein